MTTESVRRIEIHPRSKVSRLPLRALCLAIALLLATLPAAGMAPFANGTSELAPDGLPDGQAAWGDYDNDGWPDLIAGNHLYRNDAGTLRVIVQTYQGLWGDYDNDNYLDFISWGNTDHQRPHRLTHNLGDGGFEITTLPAMPSDISLAGSWADHNGDGYLDFYMGGYEIWPSVSYPDVMLRNNQDGTFGTGWIQTSPHRARGVTSCDFDQDGDIDIYVSNYRLQPNILWRNSGLGGFLNVAGDYGVAGAGGDGAYGHTIGSSWGDLDNDGHFDLFVGNFSHPAGNQDRPMFLKNLGPAGSYHFEDKSATANLRWQESYASPALGDYDNDGDLDLFFTTVYGGDRAVLYRNDGNWRFTDVTAEMGLSGLLETYQAAWADFDNDGDLDLVSSGLLFVNPGTPTRHWLGVTLQGNGGSINASAIGAQVRIRLGDKTVTRQVESGTGQGNGNDLRLHFGLDVQSAPVTLEILWPGGVTQVVPDVAVDQFIFWPAPEDGAPIDAHQYVGYSANRNVDHYAGFSPISGTQFLGSGRYYNGTYNLSGDAYLQVLGGQMIGVSGTGTFNQSGGMSIVAGPVMLGVSPGSQGEYNLTAGQLHAPSMSVGAGGQGTFSHSDGTVNVTGLLSVGTGGGNGLYELDGGQVTTGQTVVGDDGLGSFSHRGGIHQISGDFHVGKGSGAGFYTMTASGGEAPIITDFIKVGERTIDGTVYNVYDMMVATGTDWTNSRLDIDLTEGQMYQSPFGSNGEPNPALFALWPDVEWDTYATVPDGYPASPSFAGATVIDADDFHASWFDTVNGQLGTHKVAQITLSADAEGVLSGKSYDNDTQGTGVAFERSIAGGEVAAGLLSAENEYVGDAGVGRFTQSAWVNAVARALYVGYADGSDGEYLLSGAGQLLAGDVYVGYEGQGEFVQSGGFQIVSGGVHVGSGAAGGDGRLVVSGGALRTGLLSVGLLGAGHLEIAGPAAQIVVAQGLAFGPGASLDVQPGGAIHMTGSSLAISGTDPAAMAGLENLTLIFEGGAETTDSVEAAGRDLGPDPAGWAPNFALGVLQIGGDDVGRIRLVDASDNHPGWAGSEALYVDQLVLNAGGLIDLNGLNLYYRNGGVPKQFRVGDANLDGLVGDEDLSLMLANWGGDVEWAGGNFNGDTIVNDEDLSLMLANWGGSIPVPEPVSALLMLPALALARRRLTA